MCAIYNATMHVRSNLSSTLVRIDHNDWQCRLEYNSDVKTTTDRPPDVSTYS